MSFFKRLSRVGRGTLKVWAKSLQGSDPVPDEVSHELDGHTPALSSSPRKTIPEPTPELVVPSADDLPETGFREYTAKKRSL